jgi:uncharacterized protein
MRTALLTRQMITTNHFCRFKMASTASTGTIQPKLYVLQYEYTEDALEKRKPYRTTHLAHIGKYAEKGNVVLAGAVDNPPTGGLLILRNISPTEIEQLAQEDPYVINGVVKKFTVKPYLAVVGDALLNNDLIKI